MNNYYINSTSCSRSGYDCLHSIQKTGAMRKIRTDLVTKMEYSRRYGISRPTIDRMIRDNELSTETICGVDYIKISPETLGSKK